MHLHALLCRRKRLLAAPLDAPLLLCLACWSSCLGPLEFSRADLVFARLTALRPLLLGLRAWPNAPVRLCSVHPSILGRLLAHSDQRRRAKSIARYSSRRHHHRHPLLPPLPAWSRHLATSRALLRRSSECSSAVCCLLPAPAA